MTQGFRLELPWQNDPGFPAFFSMQCFVLPVPLKYIPVIFNILLSLVNSGFPSLQPLAGNFTDE
jgi:hypothetical protein